MVKKRIFAAVSAAALAVAAVPFMTTANAASAGKEVYITSFEDNDTSKFSKRGDSDTTVLSVKTDGGHTGDNYLFASGRTKSWNGPQFSLSDNCVAGNEYTLSAAVKTAWYATVQMSMQYNDSDGVTHYSNLSSAVSQGDWVEFDTVKLSLAEDVSDVYVYFEASDAGVDICVDDFELREAAEVEIENIRSLSEAFGKDFKVGTAVMASNLTSKPFMALVKKHFGDSLTAGNEMKPESVLQQTKMQELVASTGDESQVAVSFANAKSFLNYCADNNIPVRAHTLVWHSQTPDWFFKEGYKDDGDWVSSDIMTKRMENFIKLYFQTLENEYPDVNIYACDVVNEAWTDSGVPREAGEQGQKGSAKSAWVKVYGDNSFIDLAFEYARKYAPEGCKLYYNDFNEYMPQKTDAIIEMATRLKEKGVIDGIGLQSHLDVTFPSASVYEKALAKFAATGLDIQVTELDATTSDTSEAGLEAQAAYYKEIMSAILKYKDSISALVFWGVTDDQSWRAAKLPLLFDADYTAKPAYYSIIDLADDEPAQTTTTTVTTTAEPDVTTTTVTTTAEPDVTTTAETELTTTVSSETDPVTTTTTTTEPLPDLPKPTIYGDVNLDGEVTVADVIVLNKSTSNTATLTPQQMANADVDQSGDISSMDTIHIMAYLINAYTFPEIN